MSKNYKKLRSLCYQRNINEALALYSTMMNNKECNAFCLYIIMWGCIKGNIPNECESIWDTTVNINGIKPNYVCYSVGIRAAYECNDLGRQIYFCNIIKDKYYHHMSDWHYNRLMDCYLKQNKVSDALNEYNALKESNKLYSYPTIAIILRGLLKCINIYLLIFNE